MVAIGYQADGAVRMTGTVTAWDSVTKLLTLNITAAEGSGTYNSWYVSRMLTLNNASYYSYTTYTGAPAAMSWTYDNSGVITTTTHYQECIAPSAARRSSRFTQVARTTASSAAATLQNYANWKAYYSNRRFLMRTATGRAFQALDNKFRVGFTTISDTGATQGTNRFIDVGDYDTSKKADFYKSLYTADGSSYTPLRASLAKVGRYFANKAPGQASDPMQYSCQRNFAILSTDGYWNTNSESSSYGPFQLTTNTSVGQQDAGEDKPMHDGANSIVTTTTPYTNVTQRTTTRHAQRHRQLAALAVPGAEFHRRRQLQRNPIPCSCAATEPHRDDPAVDRQGRRRDQHLQQRGGQNQWRRDQQHQHRADASRERSTSAPPPRPAPRRSAAGATRAAPPIGAVRRPS